MILIKNLIIKFKKVLLNNSSWTGHDSIFEFNCWLTIEKRFDFKFEVWHKIGNCIDIIWIMFCTREQKVSFRYFKEIMLLEYSRLEIISWLLVNWVVHNCVKQLQFLKKVLFNFLIM